MGGGEDRTLGVEFFGPQAGWLLSEAGEGFNLGPCLFVTNCWGGGEALRDWFALRPRSKG